MRKTVLGRRLQTLSAASISREMSGAE